MLMVAAVTLFSLPSCLGDDDLVNDPNYSLDNVWLAIATVVPQGGNVFYLRLDNGKTLWPAATNYPDYEPKENQRAFVSFTMMSDSIQGFAHYIKLNGIHDILTKQIAPDMGAANDSIYGTDPVDIPGVENVWVGDGYLNFYFIVKQGGQKAHYINLIQPDAENDPYMVEFRHHAKGDPAISSGSGRVAFNLASLPDTKGKTVDLKVKVRTFSGERTYTVKYNRDKTAHYETENGGFGDNSISNASGFENGNIQ